MARANDHKPNTRPAGKQTGKLNACPLAKKCGGCQLQNMTYDEQLGFKQAKCKRLLGRYGKVSPILGMEDPTHYRCKVQAAFSFDYRHRRLISGVYQSNSHRVVPVNDCLIENKKADEIIVSIRRLAQSFKFQAYDEDSKRGFLRHVQVRIGYNTGEIMVVLVSGKPMFPSKRNFVNALLKEHPEITTIVHNVNPYHTNLVLGPKNDVLYGKGYIEDELCGCTFRISPGSFYQINPQQTEVLYNTAMDFAGLTGNETFFDAYCGTGTIGIIAAARGAKRVIGVELNKTAVRDAKSNARRNRIENIEFYAGDASRFITEMAAAGEKVDVIMMDPPRAGSTEEFLTAVCKMAPPKVVYVSCNPETLARDLRFLINKGYIAQKIQPVDQFPYTDHVETVVLLSKGNISSKKVHVDFSLEDMDMSGIKTGATYEEIKSYVKKNYALTVSSLNIAQIKEKHGIKERENFNHSKKQDPKQPKCTEEKEEAILDALKYYNMV
ncbi:MAG: 23S rRNA (uracil(1939)-C(5))-methyltransferase RlmD [Clostridia bacterium]|nr:23S rRNA (uracil(1939)-C(5))-methyltransferase RlmD [Clostridia bacterium]